MFLMQHNKELKMVTFNIAWVSYTTMSSRVKK